MNRALTIIGFRQINKPLKSIEKTQDWCAKSVQSYQWRHWTQVNGCHFVAYIVSFEHNYWIHICFQLLRDVWKSCFETIQNQSSDYIETSQLIFSTSQLTGFYTDGTLVLNWNGNLKDW